jgi:hypothetical protein
MLKLIKFNPGSAQAGTRVAILLLSILASVLHSSAGRAESSAEAMEVAFVYQFTKYIEWPSRSASKELEPFIITLIGESSALEPRLMELAQQRKVGERKIQINVVSKASAIPKSEIVIFEGQDVKVLDQIRARTQGMHALVVTNSDGFATMGGMINFFVESSRLRFEINQEVLEAAKLKASSQILKLAKLVE